MNKLLTIIIFSIFFFAEINETIAQKNDSKLAFKYYNNKEYKKASSIFLEIYELTRSRTYFNYYCRCLQETKDYKTLEKQLTKQIKKYPENSDFNIELGYMYKTISQIEKAEKIYKKTISKLIPHKRTIINLANSFMRKREYEYAQEVYKKGRKLLKNEKLFHIEIGNIAYSQKNYDTMIDEYFEALSQDDTKINTIQNRFQTSLHSDIDKSLKPILEKKLGNKIKNSKNKKQFEKLLVWLYIQNKEFEKALNYAKKIDKIENNTDQIFNIANISLNSEHYDQAILAYKYIINKEKNTPDYKIAIRGYLKSLHNNYYKLPTLDKKKELKSEYKEFEKNSYYNKENFNIFINYAHFMAFNIKEQDIAKQILVKLNNIKSISNMDRAKIKMEKADIILLNGDPYESLLIFSQIENSNKNNPIGYQAKFKKAKVSYFQSEIKWAKIQLDVLKASTSKLISNDAMLLTQFIEDNTSSDSTNIALKKIARAEYLIFQNKYTQALDSLNSIIEQYPTDVIIDDVIYKKHLVYVLQGLNNKAIVELELIKKEYSYESLIDKAIYRQALLFEEEKKYEQAVENYKLLITQYPDSIFTPQSRLKYANIKTN